MVTKGNQLAYPMDIFYAHYGSFHSFPSPPMEATSKRSRILKIVLVLAVISLVFVLDTKRRAAEEKLKELSVQLEQVNPNAQANKEMAKQVLSKVRRHLVLPTDVEPTVATIVDVKALREQNVFYNKAENGDHLIVTSDRAILYDPDKDIILDVVPVQFRSKKAG